mgnify:FL=1
MNAASFHSEIVIGVVDGRTLTVTISHVHNCKCRRVHRRVNGDSRVAMLISIYLHFHGRRTSTKSTRGNATVVNAGQFTHSRC